jgi:hypothetical protein
LQLSLRERSAITGKALRSRHKFLPSARSFVRARGLYAGKYLVHERAHVWG